MHLILILSTTLLLTCRAEENTQPKDNNTPESLHVATNFRKALLEALEQLENEEVQNKNSTSNHRDHFEKDDLDASDFNEDELTKFGHKIRDKISKQESIVTSFSDVGKAGVFVHSFSANIQNNRPSKEIKTTDETSTLKYRTKFTPDNLISASVTSTVSDSNNQLISNTNKKDVSHLPKTTAPVTPETTLTSPNPTVSTPVEEEDETKAKVEDVQFIHAPLVAAFTVQQDDKGLPQKVIPIFGNKQLVQNNNQFSNQNSVQHIQASLEEKQRLLEQQIRLLQEQRRQQELLLQQQQIFQSQRQILEDQQNRFKIQPIQESNRLNIPLPQQNDQLKGLNFAQQTQSFAKQQHKITDQQNLHNLQHHPQSFSEHPTINEQQNRLINFQQQPQLLSEHQQKINSQQNQLNSPLSNRPTKEIPGTVIAFQPSISFQPNSFNPLINQNSQTQFNQVHFSQQQGLPVKAAINFQKAISIPINQPPNHLTQQQVPNQYRDHLFNNNNDNYLQDFYYRQRTLVPPPPRGNRIFRQENQVGNFGINDFSQHQFHNRFNQPISQKFNNDHQNRFNQFNGLQRNNFNTNSRHQFFNNPAVQQSTVDNRLKSLIYQSGLGQGRAQEDFNIISKVLALDHTGNYQQNFLFGESNISEKKIPFKT